MKLPRLIALLSTITISTIALTGCDQSSNKKEVSQEKQEYISKGDHNSFHQSLITLDSHVDISREYMREDAFDPGLATAMKVDFEKMKKGGLDAAVFIVYVAQKKRDDAGYQAAYQAAMKKLTALRKMTDDVYPDQIGLALQASDVSKINAEGKLVAIIGLENGFPIAKNINKVDEFYQLGARYIGLTHSGHNDICDSSSAKQSLADLPAEHQGMSEFGKQVVQRMNQLGMIVDISHASDQCVEDALKFSTAPIIASHSGARAVLDHSRNLPDYLIKAIAEKGGVIQLVGYSGFIKRDPERSKAYQAMKQQIAKIYKAEKFDYKYHEHTPEYAQGMVQLNNDYPLATVSQFVDQIEHVIKLVGVEHVGISSDFDGGGELADWKDASESQNITLELIKRGYSKLDIQKIWSGNFLRVWGLIERVSIPFDGKVSILQSNDNYFASDLEGINESMLTPSYWQQKLTEQSAAILSPYQIKQKNKQLFNNNPHMTVLESFASKLSNESVVNKIKSISKKSSYPRYYGDGRLLSDQDFEKYEETLNLKAVAKTVEIQWAMVTARADMRSYPTYDSVFSTPDDINLDRFQETALFPTEVVAILHQSKDKNWFFVTSYNYSAWIEKKHLALGSKKEIFDYKNTTDFLVITGDKVHTTFNPHNKNISGILLEMGVALALVDKDEIPSSIGGQNTYASYVVQLPTKDKDGNLKFDLAMIPRNKDVNIGYLEFNRQNIINQSFKFLGERYGWGHSFNARDCTGFVGEIYKSFGILMPRNTGQQATSQQGDNINFSPSASNDEKLSQIKQLDVGDLIYIPGHVMMYLGMENDQPYIIHDVAGLSYFKETGEYYKGTLNGVSVTPLLPLMLNQESSYLDRVYNLKKIK